VRPWLLGLGLIVYAVSFALPAVRASNSPVIGWYCAWVALTFPLDPHSSFSIPVFASGLINPLTLVYLTLRMLGKAPKVRRALAIAALSFIPLSWYVIAHDMTIEIGHVAWVAGLLMMLAPEAIGMLRTPGSAGETC
jgi:hypothetical protein